MTGLKTESQLQELPINSLIHQGQYAHLAKFLIDLQNMIEPKDQSNIESLRATALQICMFCQQCQAEMEWQPDGEQDGVELGMTVYMEFSKLESFPPGSSPAAMIYVTEAHTSLPTRNSTSTLFHHFFVYGFIDGCS